MLHTKNYIRTRLNASDDLEAYAGGEWFPALENNDGSITYDDGVCEDCEGEGKTWVLQNCGKPTSMCCGGCYEKEECETCRGTGEVEML